MNKTTKTTLIVALCLFGAGLLVCLGAFFAGGMSFSKMLPSINSTELTAGSNTELIEKSFEDSGKDIELELSHAHVEVGTSDDGKVHLSYTSGPSGSFDLDVGKESINLRQRRQSILVVTLEQCFVELLIPEDYRGDLEIGTTSGGISLEGVSALGDTELASTSGSVKVAGGSFRELSAGAVSGHISIEGTKASEGIELAATAGGLSLSGSETGELELGTTSGSIRLDEVKARSLQAASTSGGIKLDDVDSSELHLSANSGRVSGLLAGSIGDYTVAARSRTGRNNLDGVTGSGSRVLVVNTTSGSISFDFND